MGDEGFCMVAAQAVSCAVATPAAFSTFLAYPMISYELEGVSA